MTWDPEPPTTPPQSGEPAAPFAPPGGPRPPEPPDAEAPTVETPSSFRPAPTAEVPPPPPPPPAPGPRPSVPPAPQVPAQPTAPYSLGAAGSPPSVPPPAGPPLGGGPPWGGAPTPPPLPASEPPRTRGRFLRGLGLGVVVLGLLGIGFGVRSLVDDDDSTTVVQGASTVSSVPPVTIDPGSEPVAAVAQTVSPSVVQIETTDGLGSGVYYDATEGLVMTNAHVVGTATTVTVRDADGNATEGQVLGADTGTDIAVVKVEGGLDIPAATLASERPAVGQIAVAVGSPYGLDQTVTSGIVSSVNRPVDGEQGVVVNMIQTDASINPGNSGGALANREGQIIGINTAIFSQTGENTGIGFAIPIATAKKAADQLVAGQAVTKAGLGLSGPSETPNGDAGAYVESVTPDGAADAAGIQNGDLIVSVDGTDIRSFDELRGLISSHSPGETVVVEVVRDGETVEIEVTLGTLAN
jgi:putative serine protease PepD